MVKRRTGFVITRQDFMKIYARVMKVVNQEIIDGKKVMLLPVGSFKVSEFSTESRPPIDWVATKKMWKELPHTTGTYVYYLLPIPPYRVTWTRGIGPVKRLFKFAVVPTTKRAMYKEVRENKKEYL